MVVFLLVAWSVSYHRKRFPWRTVLTGLGLQFVFAVLILKTSVGIAIFKGAGDAVNQLLGFARDGCAMVFGPLAKPEVMGAALGPQNGFIFAIVVAGTIIVVSSLSALFYHWGILQKIVQAVAWGMQKIMRTSGSESLAAAANIFMGQTEAPLLIKPYVNSMTRSELMCLMTGGMATIAGGVAAVYAQMGIAAGYPSMAGHLLTASVLSAPAALLIAKIMLPETEQSVTAGGKTEDIPRDTANGIDALCRGAGDGMQLAINVIAMLIAFTAVVALFNAVFASVQTVFGITDPATLQSVFGWLNAPFAWLMGVPLSECELMGRVLGERIVLNEFFGYATLTANAAQLSERSFIIGTYALCGFANFGSIAIQVGGIGSLAPGRRSELAKFGMRAMLGGILASYCTANIAGLLL